jgi:hypothetical protein
MDTSDAYPCFDAFLMLHAGDAPLPVEQTSGYWGEGFGSPPEGQGLNGTVYCIEVAGSNIYAGGYFSLAGMVTANNVARWNGNFWSSLGTGYYNGVNGRVRGLALIGSDLYLGGSFTNAGLTYASRVARWTEVLASVGHRYRRIGFCHRGQRFVRLRRRRFR